MRTNKKLLIIIIISLLAFISVLLLISNTGFNFLEKLDLFVNQAIPPIQNSLFTDISKAIAFIFDTTSMIAISFIIALLLFIKKHKKEGLFFVVLMLVNAGFIYIIKEIIGRARPLNAIIYDSGFSFPSGHATTAVVFFGLLIYLAWKNRKSWNIKFIVSIISSFMILIIGFSRIYANVHWFSDVLGGFALGLFILFFGIFVYDKLR